MVRIESNTSSGEQSHECRIGAQVRESRDLGYVECYTVGPITPVSKDVGRKPGRSGELQCTLQDLMKATKKR